MDAEQKMAVKAQFNAYLESIDTLEGPENQVDLLHVFQELSGLKNEVRLESRQVKKALDDFRQAFTSLDSKQQALIAQIRSASAFGQKKEGNHDHRQLLLDLVGLHDRISAGLEQRIPKPNLTERLFNAGSRLRQWIQAHQKGQEMTRTRIEEIMARNQVKPMQVVGRHFDPMTMQAVATAAVPDKEEGLVLEEQRKGFFAGDEVLRPAEVVVNKSN
ncbi:MAG: nucleotide exchange factor GrpE [Deltaproteobacteria bacterium]|nr:MAG: nucleotide exchange factor GrpE [Deltaproteobacteria bacterium]